MAINAFYMVLTPGSAIDDIIGGVGSATISLNATTWIARIGMVLYCCGSSTTSPTYRGGGRACSAANARARRHGVETGNHQASCRTSPRELHHRSARSTTMVHPIPL